MPLIVITGFPSSGKSEVANKIKEFFLSQKGKTVHLISENKFINKDKNALYSDSQAEKIIRSSLKSEVTRIINDDHLVILDALNYIKGYRYELYCVSKQHKTTHCVLQCITSIDVCWNWNDGREMSEKYSRDTFDALVMRFEAPDSRNRWDSPFFTALVDEPLPFEELNDALYTRKPPPPNQSTQLQPLSANNFIHELDKSTQEVVSAILSAQKLSTEGEVRLPGVDERLYLSRQLSLAELSRARRQFITYTKSHPVEDFLKLKTLFVQYLNKTVS